LYQDILPATTTEIDSTMSITVMKKVQFSAGHRLLNHQGKCANLHGHNYMIEFHVTGNEIDELGRVVDFADIKRLFQGWIDTHWDHGFILWDTDDNALDAMEQVRPNKIYRLPYNPTAENLARYLLTQIGPQLISTIRGYDLILSKVVVWETENSSAEVVADISQHQSDAILRRVQSQQFN
jgi:6-pyruvoyltetrahydropterin/6-carboxytetrahydropterin synthase